MAIRTTEVKYMNRLNTKLRIIGKALSLCVGIILLTQVVCSAQIATAAPGQPPSKQHLISVNFQQKPLAEALQVVARKAYFGLSYKTIVMPPKLITYRAKNIPVNRALSSVLKGTDLYYKLSANRKVIIIKQLPLNVKAVRLSGSVNLFQFPLQSMIQPDPTVSGKVTDSQSGKPLIGVNILVKGTTTGTATDIHGNYKLKLPSLQDTLIFSYIGYKRQVVPIDGRTTVNVKLKSKITHENQLVVTAFGVRKKRQDVVGAVTSLSQATLNTLRSAPTGNLTAALAGRVPGLIAFQRTGAPGANNAKFFIRGVTTFGFDRSPLILIDGVQSTTDQLARLNPDNIANFSILKDATATALYGSEAANGVILITTKTGNLHQGVIVSVRAATNISEPTEVPKFADAITFMKDADQTSRTRYPGQPLPYPQRKIDETERPGSNPYLYPTVNWRKGCLRILRLIKSLT